jgi:hypothetical protein
MQRTTFRLLARDTFAGKHTTIRAQSSCVHGGLQAGDEGMHAGNWDTENNSGQQPLRAGDSRCSTADSSILIMEPDIIISPILLMSNLTLLLS